MPWFAYYIYISQAIEMSWPHILSWNRYKYGPGNCYGHGPVYGHEHKDALGDGQRHSYAH